MRLFSDEQWVYSFILQGRTKYRYSQLQSKDIIKINRRGYRYDKESSNKTYSIQADQVKKERHVYASSKFWIHTSDRCGDQSKIGHIAESLPSN